MSDLSNESRKAKRRAIQAKQARKNRRILAVAIVIVVVGVLGAVIFSAMNNLGPMAEQTTLTLDADGKVVFEEVVELTEDYDLSGLKKFAKSQVKEYEAADGEYVDLRKVKTEGNKAYTRVEFSSIETYSDFTGYDAFYGSVNDAKVSGYDVDTNVPDNIRLTGDEKILIINQRIWIDYPYEILYMTPDYTKLTETADGESRIEILPFKEETGAVPFIYIVFGNENSTDKTSSNSVTTTSESQGE